MPMYRERAAVEAEQFDGTLAEAERLRRWVERHRGTCYVQHLDRCVTLYIQASTGVGMRPATSGDYIVRRGVNDFEVYKPALFEAVYDRVPADAGKEG